MKRHQDHLHADFRVAAAAAPALKFETKWQLTLVRTLLNVIGRFSRPVAGTHAFCSSIAGVPVRVIQPRGGEIAGCVLWAHGGGYVVGAAQNEVRACSELAHSIGCTVVAVDYRLSPEHPFPAAHDDLLAVWLGLQETQQYGLPFGMVGVSAGGGLISGLLQRLVDDQLPLPAGSVLLYPMLDPASAADEAVPLYFHRIWNRRNNQLGWQAYLGANIDQPPVYSTSAAGVLKRALPPVWLGVGEQDLFFEECGRFYQALQALNSPITFYPVAGAPHGFDQLSRRSQLAQAFTQDWHSFLARCMAPPGINGR